LTLPHCDLELQRVLGGLLSFGWNCIWKEISVIVVGILLRIPSTLTIGVLHRRVFEVRKGSVCKWKLYWVFSSHLMSHSSDESTCNTRKRIKVLHLISREWKRRRNLFRFPDFIVGNSSCHFSGGNKMDWNNNDFLTRPFMCWNSIVF
jgi:hypothetical protein